MSCRMLSASGSLLLGLTTIQVPNEVRPVTDPSQATHQIDHVIVAISDLEVGIARFEELTGVRPVRGGKHPAAGTQNALVALGPQQYLEILAPQNDVDLPEAQDWLLELNELKPAGFAASTSDIANTMELLERQGYVTADPIPGSRDKPDGTTLKWSTLIISEPTIAGAPFFIEWEASSAHPATTSPGGCSLVSLAITTNTSEALENLVSLLKLDVMIEESEAEVEDYTLVLQCPNGRVVLD